MGSLEMPRIRDNKNTESDKDYIKKGESDKHGFNKFMHPKRSRTTSEKRRIDKNKFNKQIESIAKEKFDKIEDED